MKKVKAIVERSEDAFYAYVPNIEGCTAGGESFDTVKENLSTILDIFILEDEILKDKYGSGYNIEFEVDLESVFKLLPEVNITQLAKLGDLNPGLLRQYVSGSKKASEKQTSKVMDAIDRLILKLNSITITAVE